MTLGFLTTVAPETALIDTLRRYRRPVPIGFLARMQGQRPEEIRPVLLRLKEQGVISITQGSEGTLEDAVELIK